jgi:hypothetical protein
MKHRVDAQDPDDLWPMVDKEGNLSHFHSELGYKRLSRTWAKMEILLGLAAAGIGVYVGFWLFSPYRAEVAWGLVVGGLGLFVLGGYLALAGHRSHLYQSSNELTARLIKEIRGLKDKG